MGRVVGFEMNSQNPEKAVAFYSEIFGWTFDEPNWDYWPATTGSEAKEGINGGLGKGPQDYPHGTRVQIEVENMEDTIQKAVGLGAQIVRDKMEFDEFYLAYLVDPVGNGIGLIQKK